MSKIAQNLVVLIEPSDIAWETSLKGGNMILNRFCIDEDAAFELSGVTYLKKFLKNVPNKVKFIRKSHEVKEQRKLKGKEDSFLQSYFKIVKLKN